MVLHSQNKNLHKKFDKLEVLKGIDEHIRPGEVVAVIGPSGSGKSTFLRCLNLLEDVTEGEIYVDDQLITDKNVDINKVRQRMGMVFQQFNLFPHLKILDNITLAPVLLKLMTKEEAKSRGWDEVDFDEAMSRGRMYLDYEKHAYEAACNLFKQA